LIISALIIFRRLFGLLRFLSVDLFAGDFHHLVKVLVLLFTARKPVFL
jgi:hypothetical protein